MNEENIKLEYNTEREALSMPEYGRNILKMVETLREIPDIGKRTEQARAIVKVMEILNPQVHSQEDFRHKLWDHLYMIAGYDLEIDSPYPAPLKEEFETKPITIPMKGTKIKAYHYGRNIERVIGLLCDEPDGELKTEMIRSLALYMRQQYLIWNKDSVADETIFADIVKLSDGRCTIPEGLSLGKINFDENYSRPGLGAKNNQSQKRGGRRNFKSKRK